jgi:rsbT co-antagonist protein RsbR
MAKKKVDLATPELLAKNEEKILDLWLEYQFSSPWVNFDLFGKSEMKKRAKEFLSMFFKAIAGGNVTDINAEEYKPLIQILEDFSSDTASRGFTPSETIMFVISLKYALFAMLEEEYSDRHAILARETTVMSRLIDNFGIVTAEAFIASREDYIKEQVSIIAEMETPVLQVGRGILLVPIIGILDSRRSQAVMDKILQTIRYGRSCHGGGSARRH